MTVAWKQLSGSGDAAAWLQRDNYRISQSKKRLMEKLPCCSDGSSSAGHYHTEERRSHYSGRWGCLRAQQGHTHTHTHTHTKKPINPTNSVQHPLSISRLPTAVNHSHQPKCDALFSSTVGLLLCANLYSVDWLDGQSTWPTSSYERIL